MHARRPDGLALSWWKSSLSARWPATPRPRRPGCILDQIELIDLNPRIRILAQTVQPATVRSLDAIHLGTALHSRSVLTCFVTCDKRLLDAAVAAGLPALAPA
jgi:hypothetical protein